MSLKSAPIPPVPEDTARVVHAVFPRGNTFIQLRDILGAIYSDEAFADLFPTHGQPAEAPWRLALVTVFQFMEYLTDRQAADAVRSRLDWKYALLRRVAWWYPWCNQEEQEGRFLGYLTYLDLKGKGGQAHLPHFCRISIGWS